MIQCDRDQSARHEVMLLFWHEEICSDQENNHPYLCVSRAKGVSNSTQNRTEFSMTITYIIYPIHLPAFQLLIPVHVFHSVAWSSFIKSHDLWAWRGYKASRPGRPISYLADCCQHLLVFLGVHIRQIDHWQYLSFSPPE